MKTAFSRLELLEPRSLRQALQWLHDDRPVIPIAGCTDVFVGLQFGTLTQKRFLNLWNLDALRPIVLKKNTLSIGALATYTDLIHSPLVRKHVPILASAAKQIGGVQVQNRGTIGGNIANASPAGDTLPVLAVLEAQLVLASAKGIRRVAFCDFYTGYRKTLLRSDELIGSIEIPLAPTSGRQWFRKVGTRQAQAISKVVMAAIRGPRPRVALGSVAPTVLRARKTEELLAASVPIAQAQQALMEEIAPIDDIRSTAEYRKRVAANLLGRFWQST